MENVKEQKNLHITPHYSLSSHDYSSSSVVWHAYSPSPSQHLMVPNPLPCLMATSTSNFPHPHACACYISSGAYLLARLQLTSESELVFIYRRRHWFHF